MDGRIAAVRFGEIHKHFGPVKALENVSFEIETGTIHALLGENGSGKTTLMNVLYGLVPADSGNVYLDGEPAHIRSPRSAQSYGVGMIHQHFTLVNNLSVLDNVLLGLRGGGVLVSRPSHEKRLSELAESLDFRLNARTLVKNLSVGSKQQVEILKAVYRDARILILDEPTSFLGPNEIDALFAAMRKLRRQGKSILFITHKLEELISIADRVTLLRKGHVIGSHQVADTSADELADMLTNDPPVRRGRLENRRNRRVVLRCKNLAVSSDQGFLAVNDLSLDLRHGEILGLVGSTGNGQSELAEAIVGLRDVSAGQIYVGSEAITKTSARERIRDFKIGFVPGDRQRVPLMLNRSVAENSILRCFDQKPISRYGFLSSRGIRKITELILRKYSVESAGAGQSVRFLSGGNQQRLVLGRELQLRPRLLILDQPCQGLDVQAVRRTHDWLLAERARGMSILYISTEIEDVLAVADRVGVLYRGSVRGLMTREQATPAALVRLMTGVADG